MRSIMMIDDNSLNYFDIEIIPNLKFLIFRIQENFIFFRGGVL